jgi:hypothetical protein
VIGAAITVAPVSTAAANTARKTVERVDERISILLISSHSEEPRMTPFKHLTGQHAVAILPQEGLDPYRAMRVPHLGIYLYLNINNLLAAT